MDLASLGVQIDSRQVKEGTAELDKLTAAGTRAEAATLALGKGSKSASAAAAAYAASAQASARASVGVATGANTASLAMQSLGTHTRGSALQVRESLVLMREAARGDFTRMAGSASILAQSLASTEVSVGSLVKSLLTKVGVLKVTQDAELAEAATQATVAASAVRSSAQRASSAILAADTELALAQAALRVAATSEAEVAAQAQVVAAHEAVAAAAVEATIAENALAVAMDREAAAATAAAAATTIALGPIVGVLAGVVVSAGLVVGSFKALQSQVRNDHTLDNYANSLGLTKKEMKELRKEVGGLSSEEMRDLDTRARAFEITWGDVWNGMAKTASDALDLSPAWQKFKSDAADAFSSVMSSSVTAAAYMYGVWNASIDRLGPRMTYLSQLIGNAYRGMGAPAKPKDSATAFWDDVGRLAADAQKKISKNLETVRGNIVGAAEKRIKGAADTIIEDRTAKKPKKTSDHGLADALAQLDAQIKGQLALAAAYQVSDAAAIKAEARQKAEEQAIRHKGDVGIFYEKELALAVAKGAAEGGKQINQLSGQTAAQKALNDAVAAGTLSADQAAQAMQDEAQLRPHLAEYAVAEGKAKDDLATIIARLRGEQAASNAETQRAQVLASTASANDEIEKLKLEARLIGETNAVRAVALAQLAAEQFLRANPGASADDARAYVEAMRQVAQLTADNSTAQDNYNASLSRTSELLELIDAQARQAGDGLAAAFGSIGAGISTALTALTGYAAAQAKIDEDHRAAVKAAGTDAGTLAAIELTYAKKSSLAKSQATSQAISGIKSLFKEHSTAYKVMSAVEKAYAAFKLATTIASMIQDATHTASSVANSTIRATADQAAGASKMFAQLGVWAFPVVGAMIALLAALGVGGGGGGSSGPSIPTSDDLQSGAGTGSVLGDTKAKSESIAHSLEIVAANTNKDLEFSSSMLAALRSIDFGISKLAGTVARQIQIAGSLFDTSKLKLGSSGSGGFLGIGKTTTNRTLWDLGLNLNSGSVADIIANGISGSTYQTVQKIKTKSGFLGIGGGTKTSYSTTTGQIDAEITSAIQDVVTSLRDGLLSAADVIGLQGAEAILNSFNVSLGKISFKDMTGEQIEDQLNAIFSKVGDDMAGAIFPALSAMQKVGEGLFETFIRVAREYEVVDVALKSIGMTFGMIGIASVAGRDALVQLFGGLDEFVEATGFFGDQFLSDAERLAPITSAVRAEMTRLGLAGVTTREQFKQTVLGLDLTTTAGREMYAALLAVAPAFDKTLDYFEQLNKATADGLKSTVDQFTRFAESLTKYRDSLFQTDAVQGNAYQVLRARFLATANLAATGDATALGGLEGAGKDFLTAAKNNASSLQQYLRDVAFVAQGVDKGIFAAEATADYAQLQLDALTNAVSILGSIAGNTAATAAALGATPVSTPTAVPQPSSAGTQSLPSGETRSPVIEQQNATIIAQNARIIDLLTRQERFNLRLEGDGMLVRTDADTPIQTEVV